MNGRDELGVESKHTRILEIQVANQGTADSPHTTVGIDEKTLVSW